MEANAAAAQFRTGGAIADVRPYGGGNINDTFLVSMRDTPQRYILQRLNPAVFPDPGLVMTNLRLVTDHMHKRLQEATETDGWQVAEVIPCRQGADYLIDADGACWRMARFIDRTRVYETVTTPAEAHEVGRGLGRFHRLLSDLDANRLHDTLPGFHVTPQYLTAYDTVSETSRLTDASCREVIETHRPTAMILEEAKARGLLPLRVMHGDPKINNFLFAEESGRVVSMVDLDTVKPGLIQYDLGDCLRSCCNPAGEEAPDLAAVTFDLGCCRAIIDGYLGECASFLTDNDLLFFYDAVRLITFELGLRFYTDYLAGNRYFKARDEEHNLRRARVQFHLLASIEAQGEEIRAMTGGLR
ncbi:MAG: aminoglycoside phosphotransferase family protein [Desulfobulbaceae bacterium]|nr:aminoglycoside phosphotransferase family protein [Desulfobulbaceae bacterium]